MDSTGTNESSLKEGSLFANRYAIQRLIGLGGMGEVYLALDTLLNNEPVALKIIHEDLSKEERNVKRFQREIQLTRKIAHANIARTFDAGISDGRFFFSMEYLEGTVLSDLLKQGAVPFYEACRIVQQVCEGLDAIHKEGIIHRDLKPGNLILLANGVVKITDFGIARPGNSDLTKSSEVLGSAPYMAPELWTGSEVGSPSDIYALGTLFYEMLTGVLPLDGDTSAELMFKHLEVIPPRPSSIDGSVPLWLDQVVLNLLSKRPVDRAKTGREISAMIEKGLSHAPIEEPVEVAPEPQVERQQLRIVGGFTREIPTAQIPIESQKSEAPATPQAMAKKAKAPHRAFELGARVAFSLIFAGLMYLITTRLLSPFLDEILITARIPEFRYLRVFVTLSLILSVGMLIATPLTLVASPLRGVGRGLSSYLTITTRMSITMALALLANVALYFMTYGFDLHAGLGPELLILTQRVVVIMSEAFLLVPVSNLGQFTQEARQLLIGLPADWAMGALVAARVIFLAVCFGFMRLNTARWGMRVSWKMLFGVGLFLVFALGVESALLMQEFVPNHNVELFTISTIQMNLSSWQIGCMVFNWVVIFAIGAVSIFRRRGLVS